MSLAEELLDSLPDNAVTPYSADPETELHIVINADRTVTVPEDLKHIAVQHDHNIETVTFDCPRYWDGHDLSQMRMRIVFQRPDGHREPHLAENLRVDPDDANVIHFDWTISNNVTPVKGAISFIACAKIADADGIIEREWHTILNQDLIVDEGMDCSGDEIVEQNPDILESILVQLDELKSTGGVSDEQISNAVAAYLAENPIEAGVDEQQVRDIVAAYLEENPPEGGTVTDEQISNAVAAYLAENPIETPDSVENAVQGIGITTIMAITQAKYDELVMLGTVDDQTLYIIKPESEDSPDLTMIPVLRSDGTAYIDLGIAAPADAWYEVCFRGIADMDQYDAIFGNDHTMVGTAGGGLTNTWMTGYYAGSSYATFGTAAIDISTKHVFKVTSSALILDGDTENAKAITAGTKTYKNPLYLFATNKYTMDSERTDRVSGVSAIDLFYLRIWSSEDKLLHNYVPAQDSEGVACIYDTVDKAYLYNAAESGAFEYREELEES